MNTNILQTEIKFTETYKKFKDAHIAVREAMCLKVQYPAFFTAVKPCDLFAGRIKHTLVGLTPDEWGLTSFGYYCREDEIRELIEREKPDNDLKSKIEEMLRFWKTENTSAKVRQAYDHKTSRWLPSDNWMGEPGIAFPLYRLTGGNIDFGKLLQLGIPGLMMEIEVCRAQKAANGVDTGIYDAMLIALGVFIDTCRHYAAEISELAAIETEVERHSELMMMKDILEVITISRPKSFREAIQLFWLYSLISDCRNYGRMDVYLGDFLVRDLESGFLTQEKAQTLVNSLWQLMADRHTVVHNRVIIGGKGRENESNADVFALLAIEATRQIKEIEPQLSLRFYKGMNPELMKNALDSIGEGRTFPILYNDDVNIPAVRKAFGFTYQEALQYVPYGCGEYILDHKSFGTPSGVINLLKALEVTLHNGIDPLSGRQIGLSLGNLNDFDCFEKLWNAYCLQIEHFVDIMAQQQELEYKIAGREAPFLYMSMLYDDCLLRAEGMFSGGVKYLGGTLETYGNTSTADSLTAIKDLVYDRKILSLSELVKVLDQNFLGFEKERRLMLQAPKYGNDNECADNMLLKVHNHIANYTRQQKHKTSLDSYLIVIINNSANTLMGRYTSASADGRLSGESMNNGNTPSSGRDINGITAMLNSIVKPSTAIHAGAVQNMKFSRNMFSKNRLQLEALLNTYFEMGGAQAMLTVVDRNELEKAMREPEKYGHIFVRVGGFSARFVELSQDVQRDILNRTLY